MSRIKRNTVVFEDIYNRRYRNVELVSDRLASYIQLLRRDGVNVITRFCDSVLWSGIVGDYHYSGALCALCAFIRRDDSICINAYLYDGHVTEDYPLGEIITCIEAPLSYYEKQLFVPKSDDVGMSILINVK